MIKEIFKKYGLIVISSIVVILIGFIFLFNGKISLKEVNEKNYTFQYDSAWKIKEKKSNSIILKHSSGGQIFIQITELLDEYKYSTIEELIDETMYSIQSQNTGYELISKKDDLLTMNQYKGYKLLYENDNEQVMVNLFKKGDKLISIRYEAKDDCFDILLDSVNNIIYNLDIKEQKFDLKNNIDLETSDIAYLQNDDLDSKISDSKVFETANNNYYVEYSIPSIFSRSLLDSSFGWFETDDNKLSLDVVISNRNIYEYLEKESGSSVYGSYSYYKSDEDVHDFKEFVSKLDGEYLGYIYKNSYSRDYTTFFSKESSINAENVELMYSLDNNHTIIFKLSSDNYPITQKLINSIKINSFKNYASYVKIEKDGNYLLGYLQHDNHNGKKDFITLRVPDKYEEVDIRGNNIYSKRFYGLNYDEDKEMYDYDVTYELSTLSIDGLSDVINVSIKTAYGDYKKIIPVGTLNINGKEFKVYEGGYTDLSGVIFTNINRNKFYVNKKVLFYEMSNGTLYIEIDGNGKEITDEIIKELVNFTVEEKDI